jgi:hypothetical protein
MDNLFVRGVFSAACYDRFGNLKWDDEFPNVVCTEGKNLMFNTAFAGSAYTVTGPYMGLISSVSFTQVQASDTAAQINGTNQWKEAGSANAPTFSARVISTWASASAGSISTASAVSFTMTSGGTLVGGFIVYGASASSTIGNTSGKLWSAGVFTGGNRVVANTDVVNVSYSASM